MTQEICTNTVPQKASAEFNAELTVHVPEGTICMRILTGRSVESILDNTELMKNEGYHRARDHELVRLSDMSGMIKKMLRGIDEPVLAVRTHGTQNEPLCTRTSYLGLLPHDEIKKAVINDLEKAGADVKNAKAVGFTVKGGFWADGEEDADMLLRKDFTGVWIKCSQNIMEQLQDESGV
jgi:hypothetical protein